MKLKTIDLIEIAIFTALMAIGAFMSFKLFEIPFTMQTLFVLMAGLILGPYKGSISMFIYLLIGLIGVPVFASHYGGFSYIFNISFGYLIGFIFAAFITGLIAKKLSSVKLNRFVKYISASLAGYIVYTIIGVLYAYLLMNYYLGTPKAFSFMFGAFVVPFLVFDLVKCLLSSFLSYLLVPRLNKATGKYQV